MSLSTLLRETIESRKKVLDQAQQILVKAKKESRALTAEESQEWDKRHADGDNLLKDIERLEKQIDAESVLKGTRDDDRRGGREDITPETTRADGTPDTRTPEQRKADLKKSFRSWMLNGNEGLTADERREIGVANASFRSGEARALSTVTGSAGAYTVPVLQPYGFEVALKSYGGMLGVAKFLPTDSGADLPYPTMNDTGNSGEDLPENSTATSSQDPTFGFYTLRAYMQDSGIVLVPITLLEDSAFDPETWMNEALTIRLGRRMNARATTGTGANQQTGVLTGSALGVTAASGTAVTYNELLDLKHSVDPAYRTAAGYMFQDLTLKAIKKLVDGNGRPLWIAGGVSEGVQNRRPDTFDGDPYTINQDFPTMASGNKSIAYGNFSKFLIRQVKQIQFVRFTERYMDKLQIGFMAYVRWDSAVIDAGTNPIKYLKHP